MELGEALFQVLPKNYRPPSSLGYAIPQNSLIYNADPSAARYNDIFQAAQTTGSFNRCLGQPAKEGCGCTAGDRISSWPSVSDCIDRVVRVAFTQDYTPQVGKFDKNEYVGDLAIPFTITEINGRIDWCYACMFQVHCFTY